MTTSDFQFANDREIQGGDVSAWSAAYGDSVTLGVYTPVGPDGQPLPEPVEIRRIATRATIPASKVWSVRVGYSMGLPAGLIFRITYHSVGVAAPQITVNMLTWFSGNGLS